MRAAVLAAACTVASAASAQAPQTKQPGSASQAPANQQVSSDDQAFVKQAAEDGMKEVEQGKIVASKASNAQVKAYANRLVKDHTASNNELKGIARRKNIELPPPPPKMTDHRGGVQVPGDATTETKTGGGRPRQGNPTGTTGASGTVQTTGEARDQMAGAEPWMSQTGKDFDKGFIDHAVQDHQKAIELFQNEADRGTDAQLKAFAKKTLPTLRAHLKQAQDLQQRLSTSTQ
jgi:putative membrane protein